MAETTEPGTSAVFSPGDNRSGKTVEECEDMIRRSIRTPMVKFLLEHMEKSGCTIGDRFIRAVHCNKQIAGGYVRGGGIMVCSNHMNLQDDVNQVVIHELIHAYDDCRAANLDWANCAHHACSEIRAGHLSGDCHYKRELLRGFLKIRSHEQECVRRRVLKSVIANPYCSEAAAKDAMEAVWDICYKRYKTLRQSSVEYKIHQLFDAKPVAATNFLLFGAVSLTNFLYSKILLHFSHN